MRNKVLAVIFADGEIFSNLRLTQKMHDLLGNQLPPYDLDMLKDKIGEAVKSLIQEDGVIYTLVEGDSLIALQNEAQSVLSNETSFKEWLSDLTQETLIYAEVSKVLKKK